MAAGLAAVAAAYLLPLRHYGLMIVDEGFYLHPTLRMLQGEVLYRDVWTFYAPLRHHVMEWAFRLGGPSLLLARSILVALLVATVVLAYRVGRRLAGPALAWVPAAVYALAPGPFQKAWFGVCSMGFFLLLARALEKPGRGRFLALGALAGTTLVTRQEIGLAQIGLGLAATAAPFLAAPLWHVRHREGAAGDLVGFAAGAAAVTGVVAAYYAAQGALGDLLQAVFVSAFRQMSVHASGFSVLFAPGVLKSHPEGAGAVVALLAPAVVYPLVGVALAVRVVRRGIDARSALVGALLVYGAATLSQAWHPPVLFRLQQSALPLYLLVAWGADELAGAVRRRGGVGPWIARAVAVVPVAAGAALVWLATGGAPIIGGLLEFSGTWRMRAYDAPVRVLGDTTYTDWHTAEEVRLVRAFFEAHTRPGEPVFVGPSHSLYYVLLDRPNPTRIVEEHMLHGDHILSDDQKREEMARLLASPTRYALIDASWWASPEIRDRVHRTLLEHFRPIRHYGASRAGTRGMLVLERRDDAPAQRFGAAYRRFLSGRRGPGDLREAEALALRLGDEPLPHALLGKLLFQAERWDDAARALEAAWQLDPADAHLLEQAASIRLRQRRLDEAATLAARARAVRPSPELDRLEQSIARRRTPRTGELR